MVARVDEIAPWSTGLRDSSSSHPQTQGDNSSTQAVFKPFEHLGCRGHDEHTQTCNRELARAAQHTNTTYA
eukprot:4180008-Pyramimonas_sp.AAC.1